MYYSLYRSLIDNHCYPLKVEANLTQILNSKVNFHTEFEPFFKKKYANNGGHFKIVSIKIKKLFCSPKTL